MNWKISGLICGCIAVFLGLRIPFYAYDLPTSSEVGNTYLFDGYWYLAGAVDRILERPTESYSTVFSPLYTVLMYVWHRFAGVSQFTIRLASSMWFLAGTIGASLAAYRITNRRSAALTTFFVLCFSYQVWLYSRVPSAYSLSFALSGMVAWLLTMHPALSFGVLAVNGALVRPHSVLAVAAFGARAWHRRFWRPLLVAGAVLTFTMFVLHQTGHLDFWTKILPFTYIGQRAQIVGPEYVYYGFIQNRFFQSDWVSFVALVYFIVILVPGRLHEARSAYLVWAVGALLVVMLFWYRPVRYFLDVRIPMAILVGCFVVDEQSPKNRWSALLFVVGMQLLLVDDLVRAKAVLREELVLFGMASTVLVLAVWLASARRAIVWGLVAGQFVLQVLSFQPHESTFASAVDVLNNRIESHAAVGGPYAHMLLMDRKDVRLVKHDFYSAPSDFGCSDIESQEVRYLLVAPFHMQRIESFYPNLLPCISRRMEVPFSRSSVLLYEVTRE